MKIFVMIILGVFAFSPFVSAHSKTEPVIKLNGEVASLTNSANLPLDTGTTVIHDTDYATHTYQVNQKIMFDLMRDRIRVIPDYIDKSSYQWDFGDGTPLHTMMGLSMDHVYKKPGFYLAVMSVIYPPEVPDISGPVYIESVYLEIVDAPKTTESLQNRAFKSNPETQSSSQTTPQTTEASTSTPNETPVVASTAEISNEPEAKTNSTAHKLAIPGIILATIATGFVVMRKKK